MPRAKGGPKTRQRRKKVLKQAKGYWGGRRRLYKSASETVLRALAFAHRDRRAKKRQFRALWVVRINAACRALGLTYSSFMNGLKQAGVSLDRKVLADLVVHARVAFARLLAAARSAGARQDPSPVAGEICEIRFRFVPAPGGHARGARGSGQGKSPPGRELSARRLVL